MKTFVHNDIRLRGFSSVSTVSYETLALESAAAGTAASTNDSLESSSSQEAVALGYRATYHLLCGAGYGTFTLWRVCLMAQPVRAAGNAGAGASSSPTAERSTVAVVGTSGEVEEVEVVFKYSQTWEVLQTGSVNRSMVFGLVLNATPHRPTVPLSLSHPHPQSLSLCLSPPAGAHEPSLSPCSTSTGAGIDTSHDAQLISSPCNFMLHGIETDIRIYSSRFTRRLEELSEEFQGQLAGKLISQHLPQPHLSKGHSFRGVTNVLAGSTDGLTLFSGVDELLVHR